MTIDPNDLDDLGKWLTSIDGTKHLYTIDIDDDVDVAAVAVLFNFGRFSFAVSPVVGDDFMHVEFHQFVDGNFSGPSGALTIRP